MIMSDPADKPTPRREPVPDDDSYLPNTQRVPRYDPDRRPDDLPPKKKKPKVEDDPWGDGR
jgi:hypothetical protein